MAYENRPFQTGAPATPPVAADPLVDNTSLGDVQVIKEFDPTAGSITPLIGQKARAGSKPVTLATEDLAALASETTVAAILAKIIASPASETTLAAILAKLIANPATETTMAALLAVTGTTTDAPATGNGTAIALLKQLRVLFAGGLPAALVDGRLDVNVGAGSVSVSNFPASQTISGAVTTTGNVAAGAADSGNPLKLGGRAQATAPTAVADGDRVSAWFTNNGALVTKEQRASASSVASVAASASNVTLLASNANRFGATIYNDSAAVLYLKLGATASAASFTLRMAADSYYEVPFGYTGIIDGLWASATGSARVTEVS